MVDSQNNISNGLSAATNIQDEINLIDYFMVIWRHKYMILFGAVLPAFILGLILFFSAKSYKTTYVYSVKDQTTYNAKDQGVYGMRVQSIYGVRDQSSNDMSNWNLDEKNYNVFLGKFYSGENIDKIANKLREKDMSIYAELISGGAVRLKQLVDFNVWPSYAYLSKARITNDAQLEHPEQLSAQLLNMIICTKQRNDIYKLSSVIRDNLENVISVYMVEEHLNVNTRKLRSQIADIEDDWFELELALKTNKTVMTKLKNIQSPVSDENTSSFTLQFDIGGKTEYLPLKYQIQVVESKTTQLEGEVETNEKRYIYYKNLLTLNEKLLVELANKTSSYYTITQFHSFLTDLADSYKDKELKSYLNSYIKRIENRMSAREPVTENPTVYTVENVTVRKSAFVFVIWLTIFVFAAFLLEGIRKRRDRTS